MNSSSTAERCTLARSSSNSRKAEEEEEEEDSYVTFIMHHCGRSGTAAGRALMMMTDLHQETLARIGLNDL
ncbi:hypothetical protein TYRP_012833 [Tyrophagus putrescentiae]|nr:hypothetical protein TYRP_012833 [Tyrophagus putrescentiae]